MTETYPPEVNGVAMTVARVVDGLLRQGHAVQLIRPRQGPDDQPAPRPDCSEVLTRGLPIPKYPQLKLGLPAGRLLERLWRTQRPDVIHLATEGPLGWSALQAARRLEIPTVSEFRTNFHAYSRHYGIGFLKQHILRYLRHFHNRSGCTMVPTSGLKRELDASGFERLKVVTRGVDTVLFNPGRRCEELRRSWQAGPDTLVVTCVGRLAAEKNLSLLVAAFARIQQVRPDAKLVLVGDGPAQHLIRQQCPEARFAGKRFGEDLARHYASADLLLFPSLTETFGNVTLEGMASGLGVLAFDYGAAGALIQHGQNGWLAPYDHADAYLQTATQIASDLTTLRRLGAAAHTTARSMSWERILSQIVGHYREAMQRNWESVESPTPAAPAGVPGDPVVEPELCLECSTLETPLVSGTSSVSR